MKNKNQTTIKTTILLDKRLKSGTIIKINGIVYKVRSSIEEGFLHSDKGFYTTLEVLR